MTRAWRSISPALSIACVVVVAALAHAGWSALGRPALPTLPSSVAWLSTSVAWLVLATVLAATCWALVRDGDRAY